jgi:hypothetical protein
MFPKGEFEQFGFDCLKRLSILFIIEHPIMLYSSMRTKWHDWNSSWKLRSAVPVSVTNDDLSTGIRSAECIVFPPTLCAATPVGANN